VKTSLFDLQKRCIRNLAGGCNGPEEERLRAALGLCEKAGALAREVRGGTFCHASAGVDKALAEKALRDSLFWLSVAAFYHGLTMEDVADSLEATLLKD
jgi:hypothetical protein